MSRKLTIFALFLFSSFFGAWEAMPRAFFLPDVSNVVNPDTCGQYAARLLASYGEIQRAYELAVKANSERGNGGEIDPFEIRLLTELGLYERADSLLALSSPVADDDDVSFHYLRRARLNLLSGNAQKALELLPPADSTGKDFSAGYREYLFVHACDRLGKLDDAVQVAEAALENGLPPALSPDFEIALVDVYRAKNRERDACDLLSGLIRRTREYNQKLPLLRLKYDIQIGLGELTEARSTAMEIARSYGRYGDAGEVTEDLTSRLAADKMENDELLAHTGVLIEWSSYRKALSLLNVLEQRKLNPAKREEIRILKAEYNYRLGRYEQAARLSKPRFQTPAFKRQSILLLARSCRRLGQPERSAGLYEYFAEVFPNDVKTAEALYVASSLYDSAGNSRAASRVLDNLRKSYPSSYYGRVSAVRSATRLMDRGEFKSSKKILNDALKRSRRTDESALYYLGVAYSKTGDKQRNQLLLEELFNIDPHSFYLNPRVEFSCYRPHTNSTGGVALYGHYGLIRFLTRASTYRTRAYQRLKDELQEPGSGGKKEAEGAQCLARGRRFLEAGFRDWGEKELEAARILCLSSPDQLLELARIYDLYGMPWQSVRLYQKVKDAMFWKKRREFSDEFRQLMYPIPYPIQVLENSAQYDLPPHLVYAMIREESRFDLNAVSRVGALGLMQLMPETGEYVAREMEMPHWGDESLLQPDINLAFGIWYASSLMDVSRKDPLRMLAAYNAGPKNAKRWFGKRPGNRPAIDVVDNIDFKETRTYVQRVVESASVYHSLYFHPGVFGSGPGR